MADRAEIDLIVEAISKGFDKIEKDLKGVGSSAKEAGDKARQGSDGTKAFGQALSGLKTAAMGAAVVIGGALIAGLAKTVMAASDAEESMSKFNVVFKDLEGGPDALAQEVDRLAEATGRSKYELIGAVGALGDLFQPLGFSTEAAADLSLQMTSLAIDLSSFNNMPMDEALRRLQGTLIGSHENALAFGVVINENTLKAEMAANGWDKLTGAQFEQAKVQARLNLLMAGTTAAQGDAIRTADGFANQMKALQGEMKDLAVEIGQKFLPAAIEAIGAIREMADSAIPSLLSAAEKAGPVLLNLVNKGIKQISLASSTADLNNLYKQLRDLGVGAGDLSDILGESRAQFDLWRTDADMADDLARNEAGVRKLNYALIGLNMGLSSTPRVVGSVANGFQEGTSELADFVAAMEEMTSDIPPVQTGMEYWALATRKVESATEDTTEAITAGFTPVTQYEQAGRAMGEAQVQASEDIAAANAEMQLQAERAAAAALAIAEYKAATGDYATQAMNAGAAGVNLNEVMYQAADAAGAEAGVLVGLALAQGTITAEKAKTILVEAALIAKATEYGQALAAGTMTINEAVTGLQNLQASFDNSSLSISTSTGNVALLGENIGLTADEAQRLTDKLNGITDVEATVTVNFGDAEARAESLYNKLRELGDPDMGGGSAAPSGGGGASGGGGNIPQYAEGGSFVVPAGYPAGRPGMPIGVHSGERVNITPAGKGAGAGNTYNLYVTPANPDNVMQSFNYMKAISGA